MSHAAPSPHRSSSPSPGNYEPSHRSGKWDSGFFDVFAVGCREMCQAHFCPCVTYAQNEQTLQQLENPDLHHSKLRNACQIPFYCSLLCCGAHCLLHQRYRLRIRSLYQINYGPYGETGDFLMSCFCVTGSFAVYKPVFRCFPCCALIQERRMLKSAPPPKRLAPTAPQSDNQMAKLPPQGSDIWSSSIFGVFEDGCATCLLSMCVPFIVHGQNAERYAKMLDPQASNCIPEAVMFCLLSFGVPIAASAAAYFVPSISYTAGCLPFVAVAGVTQVPLRRKVRDMYGISERDSCCGSDFLTSSCCLCCNIIQISRQLKKDPPNQRR